MKKIIAISVVLLFGCAHKMQSIQDETIGAVGDIDMCIGPVLILNASDSIFNWPLGNGGHQNLIFDSSGLYDGDYTVPSGHSNIGYSKFSYLDFLVDAAAIRDTIQWYLVNSDGVYIGKSKDSFLYYIDSAQWTFFKRISTGIKELVDLKTGCHVIEDDLVEYPPQDSLSQAAIYRNIGPIILTPIDTSHKK